MEHCLFFGTEVGLAAMEQWIIVVVFLGQRERWCDGSSDHSLILGTKVGLTAVE